MEKLKAEAWSTAQQQLEVRSSKFRTFQKTYYDDWPAFVHDCVDWRSDDGPTRYQDEIIADLQARGREAVRGPHGLGKTALASWVLLAFALTRDGEDWKVPTTASVWRQLTKYLWPEIHKWARRLRWDVIGRSPFNARDELLTRSLKLATGEAFPLASNDADSLEGAHADHILYIFDEAKAIPDKTFDAAEGAFAGAGVDTPAEAFALAISTPGTPHGRFYDIHARKPGFEDWHARHVTLDEAIAAGRISREWAEQRRRQWGEHSAVYQNRVLGEFAVSGEDVVIPLALVERANELWDMWADAKFKGAFRCAGVDVGRGGDPSIIALRFDGIPLLEIVEQNSGEPAMLEIESGISELRRLDAPNTMTVTGAAKGILDKHGGYAVVDVIGIGAGVVDRLREMGKKVQAFNAGGATKRKDKSGELGFADTRSAAWWAMRERLEEGMTALPPDDALIGELTAPRYDDTSTGKRKVESKKELRKPERIGKSTDRADAVIQAYWEEESGWVSAWSGRTDAEAKAQRQESQAESKPPELRSRVRRIRG